MKELTIFLGSEWELDGRHRALGWGGLRSRSHCPEVLHVGGVPSSFRGSVRPLDPMPFGRKKGSRLLTATNARGGVLLYGDSSLLEYHRSARRLPLRLLLDLDGCLFAFFVVQ